MGIELPSGIQLKLHGKGTGIFQDATFDYQRVKGT